MKIIETIKTLFLEFEFISDHISKKTNERLMKKRISKTTYKPLDLTHIPSSTTRNLYKTYTTEN
jgi:hypothetical protein